MSVEAVQKVLLSAIPIFFYFFPEVGFPYLYTKYVKSAYRRMGTVQLDAFEQIADLKARVSRLLSFVAFLSIVAVTLISSFYSKQYGIYFYEDCLLLALLVSLIGLSFWLFLVNIQKNLAINSYEKWLEIIAVLLTWPLFYYWG